VRTWLREATEKSDIKPKSVELLLAIIKEVYEAGKSNTPIFVVIPCTKSENSYAA